MNIVRVYTKYDAIPSCLYGCVPKEIRALPVMPGDVITIPDNICTVQKHTAFKVENGLEGVKFVHYTPTFIET